MSALRFVRLTAFVVSSAKKTENGKTEHRIIARRGAAPLRVLDRDKGQVVGLPGALGEAVDFVEHSGDDVLGGLVALLGQHAEEPLAGEFFACWVGAFGHAIGVEEEGVFWPEVDAGIPDHRVEDLSRHHADGHARRVDWADVETAIGMAVVKEGGSCPARARVSSSVSMSSTA